MTGTIDGIPSYMTYQEHECFVRHFSKSKGQVMTAKEYELHLLKFEELEEAMEDRQRELDRDRAEMDKQRRILERTMKLQQICKMTD